MRSACLLCLALTRGDPAEVPDTLERDMAAAPPLPVARASLAAGRFLRGQEDEAAATCRDLVPTLERARDSRTLAVVGYLTEVAIGLGDTDTCAALRQVYGRLAAGSRALGSGTVYLMGSARRTLGRLDLAVGDHDVAAAHLREGLALDERLGAPALRRAGSTRARRSDRSWCGGR
jgi:hypothetical protein